MKHVWLSLGSNLLNPPQQIQSALKNFIYLPNTKLIACSSFYRSRPFGLQNQPDFLNVVVLLKTLLSPIKLLNYLQIIELNQGRKRTLRYGPRTLDIDILLYEQYIITTKYLTIPHYALYHREFVLYPLAEIISKLSLNFYLPNGKNLIKYLRQIPLNGLTYWNK